MRTWKERFLRVATEWFDLPADVVAGESRITCVGDGAVVVENMTNLRRVAEDQIEVELASSILCIDGANFRVDLVTDREVHVHGQIRTLTFVREGVQS